MCSPCKDKQKLLVCNLHLNSTNLIFEFIILQTTFGELLLFIEKSPSDVAKKISDC